jgi:prepilin-type N-terminal cleavage/methylation domain-containing protein
MDFKQSKKQSGFSIIEVLVAMFIFSLIIIAVFSFQKDIFSYNRTISDSLATQDEIRRALKIMIAEIRTSSPSNLGAYALVETANSSFIFYSNIDKDQNKERVRYFLDGTTLKKGVIKPSGSPLTYNPTDEVITELVHDVSNGTTPIFSYYDATYDGTTPSLAEPIDIAVVRLIKITVTVDKDPTNPPGPITLTTQVSMRNLKDNL